MWRMNDGDRVLTKAEWRLFAAGLDMLRDSVEADIAAEADDTDTGARVFDSLTPEQKLALLADTALPLRDPAVPIPHHTAANEGTIMAVLNTIRDWLRSEVEDRENAQTTIRSLLRAAVADSEDLPERLPKPTGRKWDAWDDLHQCIVERVLWDYDFDMGDEFLDLPPDDARAMLRNMRVDPDYFLTVPAEPGEHGLNVARQTLARLIGLAVPDDDGL